MLPQNNNPNRTIYINPNFKGQPQNFTSNSVQPTTTPKIPFNAHINPLFLQKQIKRPINAHINPRFLLKLHEQQQPRAAEPTTEGTTRNELPTIERKIICKSKNRLIREPVATTQKNLVQHKSDAMPPQQTLIIKTKRKLIRKPVAVTPKTVETVVTSTGSKSTKTKYKIDNRITKKKAVLSPEMKRKSFVGRYALRRTSASLVSSPGILKTKPLAVQSMNKKLQVLNINGLLYRSTRNSLQLKDMSLKAAKVIPKSTKSTDAKPSQGLTIFVRGTKYIMDDKKFKLTRVPTTDKEATLNSPKKSTVRRRIDIGGFTYISAPSAKNVFIRSSNHLARAYVYNAKQKSLQTLSKHLVKSNIPCPIYQRVGKCAAFERGKCLKVHNKQQIAICSKFLRGECENVKCLLSHDVSLSKMPVCKFFLQGVCVRNDCPYLHKKLSNNAEVCIDFLRGFCQLADKCKKRHEFVCPEHERSGSCPNKNCIYCKSKIKRENYADRHNAKLKDRSKGEKKSPSTPAVRNEKSTGLRYFIGASPEATQNYSATDEPMNSGIQEVDNKDTRHEELEEEEVTVESSVRKRPKLGTLPAFIPL